MKRFYICIIPLFLFCSCRQHEKERFVIGFSQCMTDDIWRQNMISEMKIEASQYDNLTLLIEDAAYDSKLQLYQIEKMITKGVDVLIISPNESAPITPIAEKAYRMGIPVIIIDRKIESERYTTYIGADNYAIGHAVADYVSKLLDGHGRILEIKGSEGSSPARDRHQGLMEHLRKHPEMEVESIDGKWRRDSAYAKVNQVDINRYDLIFGHNDMMTLGAREAIAAKCPEKLQYLKFVGVDASVGVDAGLEAVIDGKLTASFLYPTGGDVAIRVAMQILQGEPVQKQYILNTGIIDQSNARTLLLQSEQILDYQRKIDYQQEKLAMLNLRYNSQRISLVVILILMLLVLAVSIAAYFAFLHAKRANKQLSLKNRQIERQHEELAKANKQIEEATAHKLRFFTNVSHEVKTPLTLIMASVESLLRHDISAEQEEELQIIRKNSGRLLRVINQILDFRKVENAKMAMNVQPVEIVAFVAEVKSYFDNLAHTSGINYTFHTDTREQQLYIDPDMIEKAMANLISNAFKFSKKGGDIEVRLHDHDDRITLSVRDTGIGISEEDQQHIFNRFFRGNEKHVSGTGIGLNLTREFIHLHHGEMYFESEYGKGSCFSFELLKGAELFDTNEISIAGTADVSTLATVSPQELEEVFGKRYDAKLLIVEDDPDIMHYLRKELIQNFDVLTASNGKEAMDILKSEEVSIVLSDILMPGMNGFELCAHIKGDIHYSHIPVVLLTALSDERQRIYGASIGADDYIQKPFNMSFVRMKMIRLLESRRKLRDSFMQQFRQIVPSTMPVETVDDLFIKRLLNLMEKHYENPDFNVEKASGELGLSRVHLFRKLKEITGETPTDFLKSFRLKKAAEMLQMKKYNISEVSYACGFSSPAYFTKCFRDTFGKTPSEFAGE